jgi:hypothetical protein
MIILQQNQHQNKNITGLKSKDGIQYNYTDFRVLRNKKIFL